MNIIKLLIFFNRDKAKKLRWRVAAEVAHRTADILFTQKILTKMVNKTRQLILAGRESALSSEVSYTC